MKIFNVSIQVAISQIAEIPDHEPEPDTTKEAFNDDPLQKADKMMTKWMGQLNRGGGGVVLGGLYPGESDGTTMRWNIRIAAETFEELQAILAKFHAIAKQLPAVPESLIRQNTTSIG